MPEDIKPAVPPVAGAGTETDYEALYKEQAARLLAAEETARNLRKGYNKYKTIAKEKQDDGETADIDAMIDTKVKLAMANSTTEAERQKLEEINLGMARKLKELSTALSNKGQLNNSAQGAGGGDAPVPGNEKFLSPTQVDALKAKGWDDKKIELFKKNLQKSH